MPLSQAQIDALNNGDLNYLGDVARTIGLGTILSALSDGVLPALSISTAEIADDAVTADKIADDAVETAQIADDAVTVDQIADDAVDSDQVADGAIDAVHLAANAVPGSKIDASKFLIVHVGLGVDASIAPANATVTGVASGDKVIAVVNLTDLADATADFAATANGADTISQLTTDLSAKTLLFLVLSVQ